MFSRIAVRRPVTTVMIFAAAVMLGLVSYNELAMQLYPDITFPGMAIWANYDASASEMLETVTKPMEEIAMQLPRVKEVNSFTRGNRASIWIQFEFGTDLRFVALEAEEKLNTWRRSLDDTRLYYNVFPFSTEGMANEYMELYFQVPDNRARANDEIIERVEQGLKAVQGVAQVELRGRLFESARVSLDTDRLRPYGIGFNEIISRVAAAAAEQPDLGRVELAQGGHAFVRIGDRLQTVEELGDVIVDRQGVITLKDVADITLGGTMDTTIFRINGKSRIGITLSKEAGANLIDLAHETRKQVKEINASLPPGHELVITEDAAEAIEKMIRKMSGLALMGILLAGLSPLLFLRSLRMAAIIFLSIPISLISTFNAMYASGLSINVLTIVGLAIGVSILVDNSIVVLENGFRLSERGLPAHAAAETGGDEVGRALLASTATTLAVFVPIFFSEGALRIIFREGALAIAFPLIISLFVALTLVPVMTAKALALRGAGEKGPLARWFARHVGAAMARLWPWRWEGGGRRKRSLLREAYRALLKRALRYRGRTIVAIALFCAFTFYEQSVSLDRSVLNTDATRQHTRFFLHYPRGTKLELADASVRLVEERLAQHPAIERYSVFFDEDQARFSVRLKPYSERPDRITMQEFEDGLFEFIGSVPGAILSMQNKNQPNLQNQAIPGSEGRVELIAAEGSALKAMAERASQALMAFPEITEARPGGEEDQSEMRVKLDRERAALFDINAQQVARYIGSTRSSGTLSTVKLEKDTRRTDIIFELANANRETLDDIRTLTLFSSTAGSVPLSEVATFEPGGSENSIFRKNRLQSQEVTFRARSGTDVPGLTRRAVDYLRTLPNPGGVTVSSSGIERERFQREEQATWIFKLAILLVFMVMAFIFESYWAPLVILCSIPLISIGVIWALLITNQPVQDLVWFGVILLAGLVVNAPIVMLDRTQQLRRAHGYRRERALFQACDQRLRPVLMTAMTTVLGLLPLALNREEDTQSAALAITVIGGLISSTALTLLVIPCLYLAVEDLLRFLAPPFVFVARIIGLAVGTASRAVIWMFEEFPGVMWRLRLWRVWLWPVWAWRGARAAARGLWIALKASWRGIAWAAANAWAFAAWTARIIARMFRRPATPPPAPLVEINRELPSPLARARHLAGFSEEAPPLELQNLRVIYPSIRAGEALRRAIPSRRYVIGGRPRRGFEALAGLNLAIEPGLFGLLGPNGAGKTTLLRCMAGLLQPSRGTVRVFGAPLRDHPETLAPLIGYLPQYHGHYNHMTLREYLEYFLLLRMRAAGARLERPAIDRAVASAAEETHLLEFLDERIGAFSGGMRQRAGLARVLLGAPPVVLVDEPTAGLDPVERVKTRLLLAQLARTRTVVFSTHIVEDLELSCRAVGILRQGRLLYAGAPAALLDRLRGRIWETPLAAAGSGAPLETAAPAIPAVVLETAASAGAAADMAGGAGDGARKTVETFLEAGRVTVAGGPGDLPLDARVEIRLFRVARPDGIRWRVIAPAPPTPDSTPASPRLEDAFLALLRA